MRKTIYQGLNYTSHQNSYDSIDDVYLIDNYSQANQSTDKKDIFKKLLFNENDIQDQDTPQFIHNKSPEIHLPVLRISEHNHQENKNEQQLHSGLDFKGEVNVNLRDFQKKRCFSIEQKENQFLLSQECRQNEYLSSDKQLFIMKQTTHNIHSKYNQSNRNNQENHNHSNLQTHSHLVSNQREEHQIIKRTSYSSTSNNSNQNNIVEFNQQLKQQIENQIQYRLNSLYEDLCLKIYNTKIEMFKKDKFLSDISKHEGLKYKSMHERGQSITKQVHAILQNI